VWIPVDDMSASTSKDVLSFVIGSHTWGLFRPKHFVDATPFEGTEHMDDMPDKILKSWYLLGRLLFNHLMYVLVMC
jgi:hypothetical protein